MMREEQEKRGWRTGSWWPIWHRDWYGDNVSKYPFDPYSFTHFLHGIIMFAMFGWWPHTYYPDTIEAWWWMWLVGAAIQFCIELTWEAVENSEYVINKFRQNSGTSSDYEGDSIQNIVGDLTACTSGWFLSVVCWLHGVWYLPLIWIVISEVGLMLYIRDNLTITVVMMTYPIDAIKKWQAQGVIEDKARKSKDED